MDSINRDGSVKIVFHGFRNLGTEEDAIFFFQEFCKINDGLMPRKIGLHEPIRIDFSLENARKAWMDSTSNRQYGGILFKGRTVRDFFGDISWRNSDNSNIIGIYISMKYLKNTIESLINFVKKVFIWSNCVYGYGYHSSQGNVHYTPGLSYQDCLGGITWMTLLGEPYTKMFGKSVIRSAPCIVEEFSPNAFMLLTSEEPVKLDEYILSIQQKVKSHLGEDAFFRGVTQWTFTPEEIKAGKHRLISSKEGYRSPDFSPYKRDA